MSPVATRTICEDPGNILWIWLSALSCGSCLEKKNVSSTFGFKSTVREKNNRRRAVPPRHSSTGKGTSGSRFQPSTGLCEREFSKGLAQRSQLHKSAQANPLNAAGADRPYKKRRRTKPLGCLGSICGRYSPRREGGAWCFGPRKHAENRFGGSMGLQAHEKRSIMSGFSRGDRRCENIYEASARAASLAK